MCQSLSLLPHCQECGSKCCIPGETIGAPIVSDQEREAALELPGISKSHFCKVVLLDGGYYYVPIEGPHGRCIFLSAEDLCMVQTAKFADCLEYPIKTVRKDGQIVFVIDIHCPAAPHLTCDFIAKAKEVALVSLNHWDPEVYQDWLDTYIQWIKDAMELEAYLALSPEEKLAPSVY